MAALGLRSCAQALSSCSEWGATPGHGARGLSPWRPPLLRSTGSRRAGFSSCGSCALECRLSSYGSRAQLLRGMWDLPRPGLEPASPVGRRTPNHCATREAQPKKILNPSFGGGKLNCLSVKNYCMPFHGTGRDVSIVFSVCSEIICYDIRFKLECAKGQTGPVFPKERS